ncbi:DUF5966 family protein [Streptococcus caprae]|uniref:DUF5966 family protein n=1 Tax=Streptococcus caprae TaxID=1640501 RepID=A0ABV8CUH2_9STRE
MIILKSERGWDLPLFYYRKILYVEDLTVNGIWSFTGIYIAFNVLLALGLVVKVVRGWMEE